MNRFTPCLLVIPCLVMGTAGVPAADRPFLRDEFATPESLAQWTLLPPVNALGPVPANGEWQVTDQALVATGTAAPWTIRTAGDASWTDYRLSARVTIRKPGPAPDFPILDCEYDRYLPRDWFPPLCNHTGQFRYRYYAGEFDWGSDAAVWVRYQDREHCYRVQLSTIYQELILWHGIGGYLAVVPCKIVPGKSYKLDVQVQGSHIQVLLDGKKKIDYWHTCLPTMSGKIGVGAYQATAAFAAVQVSALPPVANVPVHQAQFSTRIWRTQRWVFDGNEPILLWQKNRLEPPGYCAGMLYYLFVKLRPGYRPLYGTWVGVRPDPEGNNLVGETTDINTTGEGTDRLICRFATATRNKSMTVDNTDTVTYDPVRGTYRHDMVADVTFLQDMKLSALEFCDPLTYNNKEPGLSNKYRWLPAGHLWDLWTNEDGRICRLPISEQTNLEGQGRGDTGFGEGFRMLYPDRAVCPVWEYHTRDARWSLGTCHWGYDWHQTMYWGDTPREFRAGEKYVVSYSLAGYPPMEGERIFLASVLSPRAQNPEPQGTHNNFLRVPSNWGYPVVEPAGTSFDKLVDAQVPYNGWQWYGDYDTDRQVGRTDRYSMRLDSPATVNGMMYHHMLDGNAKRYVCTFWIKTKGYRGAPPVAVLKYPWNEKVPQDVINTGLTGDNDWTEFSFVTVVPLITPQTYDASQFELECRGTGTVWLDDWSVRPLADDEQPVEKRGGAAALPAGSPDVLMDLRCEEGTGVGCADASGHGNHAKLHGVTWIKTDRRWALRFDGEESCAFVPLPSDQLRPGDQATYKPDSLTLEAWVCPTKSLKGWAGVLGFGQSPFLLLQPSGNQFQAQFMCTNQDDQRVVLVSPAVLSAGQWAHLAATVTRDNVMRLYVNGALVDEKPLGGRIKYASWYPALSIGNGAKRGHLFTGDLTGLRWWNRAATEAEIVAAAATAPAK